MLTSNTPGVCTVSGRRLTFEHAGPCEIAADQAGNDDYRPAPTVTDRFEVHRGLQDLAFTLTSDQAATRGSGTLTVTASGDSGNPVTFSPTTPGRCSVAGSEVTFDHAGTCTVEAHQDGNDDYLGANASRTIAVDRADQQLDVPAPGHRPGRRHAPPRRHARSVRPAGHLHRGRRPGLHHHRRRHRRDLPPRPAVLGHRPPGRRRRLHGRTAGHPARRRGQGRPAPHVPAPGHRPGRRHAPPRRHARSVRPAGHLHRGRRPGLHHHRRRHRRDLPPRPAVLGHRPPGRRRRLHGRTAGHPARRRGQGRPAPDVHVRLRPARRTRHRDAHGDLQRRLGQPRQLPVDDAGGVLRGRHHRHVPPRHHVLGRGDAGGRRGLQRRRRGHPRPRGGQGRPGDHLHTGHRRRRRPRHDPAGHQHLRAPGHVHPRPGRRERRLHGVTAPPSPSCTPAPAP